MENATFCLINFAAGEKIVMIHIIHNFEVEI